MQRLPINGYTPLANKLRRQGRVLGETFRRRRAQFLCHRLSTDCNNCVSGLVWSGKTAGRRTQKLHRQCRRECPWTSSPLGRQTMPMALAWGRCSADTGRLPSVGTTTRLRYSAIPCGLVAAELFTVEKTV